MTCNMYTAAPAHAPDMVPADAIDKVLHTAHNISAAANTALQDCSISIQEEAGLKDIRNLVDFMRRRVEKSKHAADGRAKTELINGVDLVRHQIIQKCQEHQGTVTKYSGLINEILDWCQLKGTTQSSAATSASIADLQPSAYGSMSWSPSTPATEISSRLAKGQLPPKPSSTANGKLSSSFTFANWDLNKVALKPIYIDTSAGSSHNSTQLKAFGDTLHAQGDTAFPDQHSYTVTAPYNASMEATTGGVATSVLPSRFQQALEVARASAANQRMGGKSGAGAAAGAAGLASGGTFGSTARLMRYSNEQVGAAGSDSSEARAQHVLPGVRLSNQQQECPGLWQQRSFLHLDRSDLSLSASVGGQLHSQGGHATAGVTQPGAAASRYSFSRDGDVPALEPAGNAGWEAVQHLRHQQPPNPNSSMRTSMDVVKTLNTGSMVDAAIMHNNAFRVHIMHDAVAVKPDVGGVGVPKVPPCLARGKKRGGWVAAIKLLLGTAAAAAVTVAPILIVKELGLMQDQYNIGKGQGSKGRKQQQQAAIAAPCLPYTPIGAGPHASAGCG